MASINAMADPPVSADTADHTTLRGRLVHAATIVTSETGWSSLTMGGLAEMIGVSRQTVYNEIGSKRQLAEEVVFTELQQFLGLVDDAFAAHPTDLVAAVFRACRDVLVRSAQSPLFHAIVSTSHGARHDLLPLLTTQSQYLIDTAKTVVRTRLRPLARSVSEQHLNAATDVLVRTILSHVMQPSASPDETADNMAWLAQQILT